MSSRSKVAVVSTSHEPSSREGFAQIVARESTDVVGIVDSTGVYLFVSPSSVEILGFTPEELVGTNAWNLVHPDDVEPLRDEQARGPRSIKTGRREFRIRTKRGDYLHCETTYRGIVDPETNQIDRSYFAIRDIDSWKRADILAKERAESYRLMTEYSTDVVVRASLEGTLHYVSPSGERVLGYDQRELSAMNLWALPNPAEREWINDFTNGATGESVVAQFRVNRKDGTTIWCEGAFRLVSGPDDHQSVEIHGAIRDVSARRHALEALRESESKFRLLAENSTDLVSRIMPDGRIVYMSPSNARILGYSPEELIGVKSWDLVHSDDLAAKMAIYEASEGASTVVYPPFRMIRRDGGIVWLELLAQRIRDPLTGEVVEVQWAARDVTTSKLANDDLRASEIRYRSLIENAPDAIVVYDVDSRHFTDANENAASLFGLSRSELLKVGPIEMSPPVQPNGLPTAEAAIAQINLALGGAKPTFEWTHLDAQGREIPCEIRLSRVPDERRRLIRATIADITDRKAAESALKISEARYRTLVEHSPEATIVVDVETGLLVDCNQNAERLFGFSRSELLEKRPNDLMPALQPDGRLTTDVSTDIVARSLAGETPWFELNVLNADGREVPCDVRVLTLPDAKRTLLRASVIDISDRKAHDEILRVSETRFRALMEHAPEAIVVLDVDSGKFVYANENMVHLTEYPLDVLMTLGPPDLLAEFQPDGTRSLPALQSEIERALKGELPIFEIVGKSASGELIPCEVRICILPDRERTLLRGSITDIRARKAAQQALLESEQQMAHAQRMTHHGSWEVDLDCADGDAKSIHWSDEAYRIFGYPPRSIELTEALYYERIHVEDRDRVREARSAAVASFIPYRSEYRMNRADGSARVVVESAEFVFSSVREDPTKMIGTIQDVTDEREGEQRLAELRSGLEVRVEARTRALAEANEALEAFSSTLAHDLRGPLRSIQGFSTAILEDCIDELGPTGVDYAQRIIRAGQRMDRLTNNLLEYSRLNAAQIELHPIDLNEVVRDAVSHCDQIDEEAGASLTIQPHLPWALGHGPTLIHAIANLVSNSIKFVGAGSMPKISIFAKTVGGKVRLFVADEGIGIAPQYIDRIFKPFERLHSSRQYEGSGIGLAIVSKAVDRMGGSVGVESEGQKGSTFWIELPGVE